MSTVLHVARALAGVCRDARQLLSGMLSRFDAASACSSVRTSGSGGSQQLSSRPRMHAAAALPVTSRSHASAGHVVTVARPLAVGLPDRDAALQAQRANLERFVHANEGEFAAMPFHPWTRAIAGSHSSHLAHTRVAASSLPGCVGLQGVMLETDLPAQDHEYQLLLYPGLLMTEELYSEFARLYHCPTALGLPALTTHPANKDRVPMLIVGDPTSHGVIINDGVRSGRAANCALRSVSKLRLSNICSVGSDGKVKLNAQVAAVWALPDTPLRAGTELLLDYGCESFWAPCLTSEPFCVSCFSRLSDASNPLVLCEGTSAHGSVCNVSRHRYCFPGSDTPSLESLRDPGVKYYCPDHLAWHATVTAPVSPLSRPRFLSQHSLRRSPPLVVSLGLPAASSYAQEPANEILPPDRLVAQSVAEQSRLSSASHLRPVRSPPTRIVLSASSSGASVARSIDFSTPPLRTPLDSATHSLSRVADMEDHTVSYPPELSKLRIACEPAPPDESSSDGSDSWCKSSRSESAASIDACDGASSLDSDSGSAPIRQRGHRTASTSVQEQHVLTAGMPVASNKYAKMKIRDPHRTQSELGASYLHNKAPFSAAQLHSLNAVFEKFALDRRARHWFIPKSAKADLVLEASTAECHLQSSPGSVLASVGAGSFGADAGSCGASAAGNVAEASVGKAATVTTQRWRDIGESLEMDWAAYKSCCARAGSDAYRPHGLSDHVTASHSSLDVVSFFTARLNFFADSPTRSAFQMRVRKMLREQSNNTVPWPGGHLCLSCFRALMGKSRGWMYTTVKLMDDSERAHFPTLKSNGTIRTQRKAAELDRVVQALRAFSLLVGHSPPNPKTRDVDAVYKFLPVKTMLELVERVAQFEQVQRGLPQPVPVKMHTLLRARKWLRSHENLRLTVGTSISLMRCADCDMFDNKLKSDYVTANKRTPQQQMEDRCAKASHLAAMQRQRDHGTAEKNKALQDPTECMVIMLDGMDQSKTQLPHRARFNKDLEPLDRMKVHAEGGFCFGGAQPVLGLLNFPDLRKDSNLCIVSVERILDLQWLKLEEDFKQRESARAADAAARAADAAAAAHHDPAAWQEIRDAAQAARTEGASEEYPSDGIGHSWPKRLHLIFDNAAGECKNQWMFRFLGLLVLHGIVHHVTVCTMLVGHTHDIVDQLFSIWARMLRVHDAETFEKMRAIFRERYISRIEGLINLMRRRAAQRGAAGPASVAPEEAAFHEMMDNQSETLEWSEEAAKVLEDFTKFVKDSFHRKDKPLTELSPHIELQSVSIDAKGWLMHAVADDLPPLKHIKEAHNFGIMKDAVDGHVYLYNKHLCDSTTVKQDADGREIKHHYLITPTGAWTTRALLYKKDHKQDADPFKIPPLIVETAKLRLTAQKFYTAGAMSAMEHAQFLNMLTRLDDAQKEQRDVCSKCADLAAAYCGHGVIHRRKGADTQEKQASQKKSNARQHAWDAMLDHLYDPLYRDAHHEKQTHAGWWTKWLKRAHEHIGPAYVQRAVIPDPLVSSRRYHDHPAHLVSGEGETPIVDDLGPRVDVTWLQRHGIPRPGQMAVLRSDSLLEPFFVAEIVSVRGLDEAGRAAVTRVQADEAAHTAVCMQEEAAEAAAAAAAASTSDRPDAGASASKRKTGSRARRPQPQSSDVMCSLKSLELTVVYWDLSPTDYKKTMHFDVGNTARLTKANAAWWTAQFAMHGTSREQLQQLLDESKAHQKPLARPVWLLDMYSSCSFINRELIKPHHPTTIQQQFDEQQPQNQGAINGSVLILWGKQQQLLNQSRDVPSSRGGKSWRLKDPMHQAAHKDLTQDADTRSTAPAAAAAVALEARHSLTPGCRKRVADADDSDGDHSDGLDADEHYRPSDDNDGADEAMEAKETRGRMRNGAAAAAAAAAVECSAAKRPRLRN